MLRRLLNEPLLHFLAAGALLFAVYACVNGGSGKYPSTIPVAASDVDWLAKTWTKQWGREPTRSELRGLVLDFIKEGLLAKEAEELDLARDDTIIRRHLAQKMTFLIEGTSRAAEPSDQELRRYYATHLSSFVTEARVSFTQVFVSPELRSTAESDAKTILVQLSSVDAVPEGIGDRSLMAHQVVGGDFQTVAAQFGETFARKVMTIAPGSWQGPVESAYGLHLVRVTDLTLARQQSFDEAKANIARLLRDERERKAKEEYFAGLMSKYSILLDDEIKALVGPVDFGSEIAN